MEISIQPVTRTRKVTRIITETLSYPPIALPCPPSPPAAIQYSAHGLPMRKYPLSAVPIPEHIQAVPLQLGSLHAKYQPQDKGKARLDDSPSKKRRGHTEPLATPKRKKRKISENDLLPSPQESPKLEGQASPALTHVDDEDDLSLSDPVTSISAGIDLSALLSLPSIVHSFATLSPGVQTSILFQLLRQSPVSVLQSIHAVVQPALKRDFLRDLPKEVVTEHLLGYLDGLSLVRATAVSKTWQKIINSDKYVWIRALHTHNLFYGDGAEEADVDAIVTGVHNKREHDFMQNYENGVWDFDFDKRSLVAGPSRPIATPQLRRRPRLPTPESTVPFIRTLPTTDPNSENYVTPYKLLFQKRFISRRNWQTGGYRRITYQGHEASIVTCLQFDRDKVISAADDSSIVITDIRTGNVRSVLRGHTGGIWAMQYLGNILVSGATDRSVRIWDIERGVCTHTFSNHTSTVRCIQIVEPVNVNPDPSGTPVWEPPYPLIVSGSRDTFLNVWKLPMSPNHQLEPIRLPNGDTKSPWHMFRLSGHKQAVRAIAAHGRLLVSGSYDSHVRIWDILTGKLKHRLVGHTNKVYSVAYDHIRGQCASGSMDSTIRIWDVQTGEVRFILESHTSLVGLLGLSHKYLFSAAADSSIKVWNNRTGHCLNELAADSGAITCCCPDDVKIVSGSDGIVKLWDNHNPDFSRDLLSDLTTVWQIKTDDRYCVVAVQRHGQSEFEILDFGPCLPNEAAEDDRLHAIKQEEEDQAYSSDQSFDRSQLLNPYAYLPTAYDQTPVRSRVARRPYQMPPQAPLLFSHHFGPTEPQEQEQEQESDSDDAEFMTDDASLEVEEAQRYDMIPDEDDE